MHFCQDELMAIAAIVPGLGFCLAWLRAKFHHFRRHKDCKKEETR